MIKVALIIERSDIILGGAERSVFELSGHLSSLDIKPTILVAKGQMNADNIKILCADTSGKRTTLADFENALRNHLAHNQYDIIHSTLPFSFANIYQPRGGSYPEAIIRNVDSFENKFISLYKLITHHVNRRRSALFKAEKQLCATSNHTIIAALSEYVRDQFRNHYNLPDKRIVVIPNGVKINKKVDFNQANKLRRQILATLGIEESDRPVMFLFAANNFRLKGLGPLIKAVSALKEQRKSGPVYLVVAGSGSSKKYRRFARKYGVSDRIAFLGRLRHIQEALSVCNVAVLPTWYDPSSRYILEALAAGKPVITTRFNGARELFTDNRHGIVIDKPNDIENLAKAMRFYAEPANIRIATEAIVQDNLEDKVSITRHAESLVELYCSIMSGRRTK